MSDRYAKYTKLTFDRPHAKVLRIRLNNTFEQKVIFDLRRDLYATLQRLPLRWYDQRATGDIITRIIDDVTSMERVLIDGVEQGIVALLQIIGVGKERTERASLQPGHMERVSRRSDCRSQSGGRSKK